ncbi:CrcB family protein [Leuconostoc mesenteroides]|uniref:CrcB family protein n=1 Tax=Leuconostoc mesenteroides TaxID=1245 RepID=UPI0023627AB7|nr:CrcB family protein [Leuconostoc mesenteroides]
MKYLKDSTLLTSCLVVFFGGSLGSLFRLLITEIPHIGSSPWVIVVINVLGSFFLAYIGAVIPDSYDYFLISIIYTLISFILAYIAVVFGKNVGKNRRLNQ